MIEFLKTFRNGILIVIFSPILLFVLSLYIIFAVANYIVCEIYGVYLFFYGKNYYSDDEETKLMRQRKESAENKLRMNDENAQMLNQGLTYMQSMINYNAKQNAINAQQIFQDEKTKVIENKNEELDDLDLFTSISNKEKEGKHV